MTPISLITVIILSLILTVAFKFLFIKNKSFDDINSRSTHKTKATKSGGISVFLTLFIYSLYFYLNQIDLFDFSLLIPLGIMFIVGVYDDFYNADFKLKFFLQIIVAKILIDQGLIIDNFYGVLGLNEIPRLAGQIFTIFVFLIIVNAFNFIDGIDGLAITETIKVILLVEFLSIESTQFFSLGTLIILSLLPIYYFNFKKDYKVFLGDAGSLFLGTLIAIYLLHVLGEDFVLKPYYKVNKPLLSMALIAYPLVDLLRVFIIRVYNKRSPFNPDQNHLHHILIKKGLNHISAVGIIQIISLSILYLIFYI